jgi:hypothetical protein
LSIGRFSQIWLQAKYISKKLKQISIILATYLKIWRFFFDFGQIVAVENLKKRHLTLALLIFNLSFWLYIVSQKKAGDHAYIYFCASLFERYSYRLI